jgi:hypothetical protein
MATVCMTDAGHNGVPTLADHTHRRTFGTIRGETARAPWPWVLFCAWRCPMAARPHDVTDLYLAPMVLAVDGRIEELGHLDKDGLAYEVALESDARDYTRSIRGAALIRTVTHPIETHGWKLSWDPRGLRLTHDAHTLVLGVPAVFLEYLEDAPKV